MKITAASSNPKMFTLPWEKPLATWPEDLLVNLPRGISRHVVRFVHVGDEVYAMKEITRNGGGTRIRAAAPTAEAGTAYRAAVAVVTGRHNAQGEPLEAILVTKHLEFIRCRTARCSPATCVPTPPNDSSTRLPC